MHKSIFLRNFSPEFLNELKALNLDSVFVDFENLSKIEDLKNIFPKINVSINVFKKSSYNSDLKNSDVVCLDPTADVLEYLCPTSEEVLSCLTRNVQKCLDAHVNGIWLNELRYATEWKSENPILTDTCYCERCLQNFESFINEPVEGSNLEEKFLHIDGSYYLEWLEFKTGNISNTLKSVFDITRGKCDVGYFAIPWEEKDYGSAIKRLLGQNFDQLAGYCDIFSPLLYISDSNWVKNKVDYFWNIGKPFLPIVNSDEKSILENASSGSSKGVCVDFFDQETTMDSVKEFFGRK